MITILLLNPFVKKMILTLRFTFFMMLKLFRYTVLHVNLHSRDAVGIMFGHYDMEACSSCVIRIHTVQLESFQPPPSHNI